MDKKYIIIGLGIILIVVVAIMMFSGGGKTKKTPTTAKLVVWDSFDSEQDFSKIIAYFENKNPRTKVEYVKKNPATYETDSLDAIASGNGPDVWIIPSNWMPKHHDKLMAMPEKVLNPKLPNAEVYKDKYVQVAAQDNIYDNKVYGVPLFMDSLSLFYNRSLLSRRYDRYTQEHPNADLASIRPLFDNVPETWDSLTQLIKYYGENTIALGAANVENYPDILSAIMLQYGAKMTSEDKANALFHTSTSTTDYTSYPGAKALTFYTSFARKGDPNYTWNPDNKSAYEAFVKGEVAMMINYTQIKDQLAKETENFGIKALPQLSKTDTPIDMAYYQVMTVPENSANPTDAWRMISYFADESSKVFMRYSNQTESAYANLSEIKNSSKWENAQNRNSNSWYNPDPAKVSEIFKTAINQALGGQNPQTVMEGTAAQVTTLLADLKKD